MFNRNTTPFLFCAVLFFMLVGSFFAQSVSAQDFPAQTYEEPDEEYPADSSYTSPDSEEPPPPPAPVKAPPSPIRLQQKVVMIGRVPYMNLKDMMEHAKGLLVYLRKQMGVKEARLVTAKDYAGVLESLSRGTIDFAWIGATVYVLGKDKYQLVPLAKTKRKQGASYRGIIFARKDGKLMGIEDVKGKTIGFVDRESASGYLYPLYVLKKSGVNPHKDCAKVEFLKKHDAVLAAVLEGKIDMGICLEDALDNWKDKAQLNQLLILGKTPEIPGDVLVCRDDCPPNLREKFQEALLNNASGTAALKTPGDQGSTFEFLPASDEDFASVREILKTVESIRK